MNNLKKSILFIAILLIMLLILSYICLKSDNKDGISTIGIAGEKNNTVDFLVIGDSEAYMSISPIEIWKQYGFTGYVKGTPAQRLYKTYSLLKESIKNQKPKIVIIETDAIFTQFKLSKAISSELSSILPIARYHDNWKILIDNNMIEKRIDKDKGYYYSDKVKSGKAKGYMWKTQKIEQISQKSMIYLNKIFDLCEKNNIKVMLLSTPSIKNWNYQRHYNIKKIAKQKNIQYFDMNLDKNLKINWKEDTKDRGDHLNYNGAKKVAKALGEYLKKLNVLEDHRNDEIYDSWQKAEENI